MARQDAEVAADIGDDGADRPASDHGRDLLRRGRLRQTRSVVVVGPGGLRLPTRSRCGFAWAVTRLTRR
jgi:hypothetical protein